MAAHPTVFRCTVSRTNTVELHLYFGANNQREVLPHNVISLNKISACYQAADYKGPPPPETSDMEPEVYSETSCLSLMFVPEYIQIIMTLEEAVQHVVMTAIQEVSPP